MKVVVDRLRNQVSRGEPVLLLGAGFSLDACDSSGHNLPTSVQLAEEFWRLAFPGDPFDPTVRLGDAFYAAKASNPKGALHVVRARLCVDAEKLPESYATWFSVPWARCYTLNIDDLEQAVARRFGADRGMYSISATSGTTVGDSRSGALEVIHLNGATWDELDRMTFSEVDYAARLTGPEQWYANCAADILTRPVVFVGTELNESTLWQYVEFRKGRGGRGMRELRPGSYLVCPALNPARRLLLRELHIDWLEMTADEFARTVLKQLADASVQGHRAVQEKQQAELRRALPHLVSELSSGAPTTSTEYLLGQEPTWADIQTGRAVPRECDSDVVDMISRLLSASGVCPPLVLTGTAGSGKSTCLMRLGLHLSAEGVPVYWIDEQSNIEPHRLREAALRHEGPVAILVDDADLWGPTASGWAREIPQLRPGVLFGAAVRSGKVDGLLDSETLHGIQPVEVSMPPLTDSDIESLIRVLDDNNRLGILKGKSSKERIEAFRREAGRQLLVAMIQATSGKKFKEKVLEELVELSERQKLLYAVICLVHSQRYSLDREEILLAAGTSDNETLNALEMLAQRHIVVRETIHSGYMARHRVIADEVVSGMVFREYIPPVLEGVCFAFANRIRQQLPRTARPWRRLIRFINHDYILQMTTPDVGRDIYVRLEPLLHWDFHYWLQRGSLEVERG